ncbi:MAG: extracellular solute-binding protein [Spirochaetia bacterium]
MKKCIVFFLFVLIMPWFLSAAGTQEEVSAPEEPLAITIMVDDPSTQPFNPDWLIIKEIEKRKNVKLDVMAVPTSDFKNKRNILLSAGDMPDIITKTWPNDITSYVGSGVLLPVSDYQQELPNFEKLVKEWNLSGEIDEFVRAVDGKFYILPGFTKNIVNTVGIGIRKDLFEKHNLDTPESYEDLYRDLKTLKEEYPDNFGLSDKFKGNQLLSYICQSFDTSAGWSLEQGFLYDRENDKWVHAPTTEGYKNMLTYLNKLVDERLLDIETFTQTPQALRQKIFNGNVAVSSMNWTQKEEYEVETKKASGKEVVWEVIPPPAGPAGTRSYKSSNRISSGLILSSKLAKNPRLNEYLDFIDWMYYSEEGRLLGNWGVEGITFEMVDGKPDLTESIFNWDSPDAPKYLGRDYGVEMPAFRVVKDPVKVYDEFSPEVADYIRLLDENNFSTLSNPTLAANEDDAEMLNLGASPLLDYTNQMTMAFILGSEDIETGWDDYVNETVRKKRDDLVDLVNRIWQNKNK